MICNPISPANFQCRALLFILALAAMAAMAQAQTEDKAVAIPRPQGVPATAVMIESRTLEERPERAIVLWMLNPEKHPTEYSPDDPYTCPDYSRGSHYSGKTRVSLVDLKASKVINTVEIKQEYDDGQDSFDVPYAIRKGYYYAVEGEPAEGHEAKAIILSLKDYNGDGKALEFALFDAQACMGLATTLIGYSPRQDKLIQYPIELKTKTGKKVSVQKSHWCDYLFEKKPEKPGYWKYEIDYRGRAGALEKYEVRYNPEKEMFEGTTSSTGGE